MRGVVMRGRVWVENGSPETERGKENSEEGICPICSKEEEWNHVLRWEGRTILRDKSLDRKVRNIDAKIGNGRAAGCKNREK
jgi:hypothetical protein